MIVDAKTLCQYHVDTVKDIQGKCQSEVNQESARLHKEAQKHQEQLEQELTEYQKSLDKQAEKAVRDRLQQEMDKVKAEMNNVVQFATGSREKLEQHYKKELAEADKIIQQERVEATNAGATTMSRQLEADIETAKNLKNKYDQELTERDREWFQIFGRVSPALGTVVLLLRWWFCILEKVVSSLGTVVPCFRTVRSSMRGAHQGGRMCPPSVSPQLKPLGDKETFYLFAIVEHIFQC
eukprot:6007776-Amphidinium_carterae.1